MQEGEEGGKEDFVLKLESCKLKYLYVCDGEDLSCPLRNLWVCSRGKRAKRKEN